MQHLNSNVHGSMGGLMGGLMADLMSGLMFPNVGFEFYDRSLNPIVCQIMDYGIRQVVYIVL